MTNEPTDAELQAMWSEAVLPETVTKRLAFSFARAVLAEWGTPAPVGVGAVPQGWKAVPVNPTPEMWKAAKTVPDPNPPYPPHYGLVWDAMLAAAPQPSPTAQAAESVLEDAARYRWLRENWTTMGSTYHDDKVQLYVDRPRYTNAEPADIDAAIDAAIAQKEGK